MNKLALPEGVEVLGPVSEAQEQILSLRALEFFALLQRKFNDRRLELLAARRERHHAIARGQLPDFLPETKAVREGTWQVLPIPDDLNDRRVEITGPVERKMVINGLNSGANCFMADFEDSHSPTWPNTLDGQVNVRDAVRGTITYRSPEGKEYRLNHRVATLLVRPRGWHLNEEHIRVDGQSASASLFDFAMYFFHNARHRQLHDAGLYLYLPKMEHYLEARLWNDVFVMSQALLDVPPGTVKATVLIEHILAAFQMEEILYELRHHSAGLNCGRWDYIFSYIKTFSRRPEFIVPDRAQVTMTAPLMRAYALSCIQTCHKRGTFAIGGMSAYIPIKHDPAANEIALEKVRQDKRREANDGHDGTWVAHPGLVAVAREEFDKVLGSRPNQVTRLLTGPGVTAAQLLEAPPGTITEEGVRTNIRVGVQYIEAWLGGQGCVPLYNLMEDAATAEISRAQLWQWLHHSRGFLLDGRRVTFSLVYQLLDEEMARLRRERGKDRFENGHFLLARDLFEQLVTSETLEQFFTLKAYPFLNGFEKSPGDGLDSPSVLRRHPASRAGASERTVPITTI